MRHDGPMSSHFTDMRHDDSTPPRRIGFDLGGSESPRADKRFGGELDVVTAEKSGGRSGTATTTNLPVRSLVPDDHAPAPGSSHAARENGVMEIGQVTPTHDEAIAAGYTITDLEVIKDVGAPDGSFSALNNAELNKYVNTRDYQIASGFVNPAVCVHNVNHGFLIATAHRGKAILHCAQCGYKEFPSEEMYNGELSKARAALYGVLSDSSLKSILKQPVKDFKTIDELADFFLRLMRKGEK